MDEGRLSEKRQSGHGEGKGRIRAGLFLAPGQTITNITRSLPVPPRNLPLPGEASPTGPMAGFPTLAAASGGVVDTGPSAAGLSVVVCLDGDASIHRAPGIGLAAWALPVAFRPVMPGDLCRACR